VGKPHARLCAGAVRYGHGHLMLSGEKKMSLIQVEFLTDDEDMQELCLLYWQVDDEGRFVHNVSDFASRFGLKSRKVASVVRQHCRAFRTDLMCEMCGKPVKYLDNRSDVSIGWRHKEWYRFCAECKEESGRQEEERRRRQAEELREQKSRKMEEAFENGVYESLNLLEFNLLVALATSKNTTIARKKVGLSEEDAGAIIDELNDLHLINFKVGIQGYALVEELGIALQEIRLQRRVKSIFGSPKAQDLYRKLKREHLFVYPEIPICAFIDRGQVEHLFTEDWHSMYFLTARVDFVVCDPEGKPKFAVEYRGGYHKSGDQGKKDEFKQVVLNEVGLPLRQITSKDLRDFEGI